MREEPLGSPEAAVEAVAGLLNKFEAVRHDSREFLAKFDLSDCDKKRVKKITSSIAGHLDKCFSRLRMDGVSYEQADELCTVALALVLNMHESVKTTFSDGASEHEEDDDGC